MQLQRQESLPSTATHPMEDPRASADNAKSELRLEGGSSQEAARGRSMGPAGSSELQAWSSEDDCSDLESMHVEEHDNAQGHMHEDSDAEPAGALSCSYLPASEGFHAVQASCGVISSQQAIKQQAGVPVRARYLIQMHIPLPLPREQQKYV